MMASAKSLQFQIHGLALLIECSKTQQYPSLAVTMQKGVLVSVGGKFMPDNPPPYRVLSEEEWIKFSQNQFKNLADIDRQRTEDKSRDQKNLLDLSSPEIKANQEGINSQLAQSIAEQPKENIIDWVKGICGTVLQTTLGVVEGILRKEFELIDAVGNFTESVKSSILSFIRYEEVSTAIKTAIENDTQYQYIKGLIDGITSRYNQALEGLKHLDNQPAIIQQIGKIAAASIPVIATITSAAIPVIGLEVLFPPLALVGVSANRAVALTGVMLKIISQVKLGNTLLKLDREARGVKEEDLKNLPAWNRFLSVLRELLFGVSFGIALNAGIQFGQMQLRVLSKVNRGIVKHLESIPAEVAVRNESAVLELRKLADEVAARPMPKNVATYVDTALATREKQVLRVLGNSKESKELLRLADNNVARIMSESDLYMKISQENLAKVIKNQRFTNAFENLEAGEVTGITFKGISEAKAAATKKMPFWRYQTEKKMFGIKSTAPGSDRPVYGFFASGKQGLNVREGFKTKNYGDVSVKLKPEVKARTTITGDDSVAIAYPFARPSRMSPFTPSLLATRIENPKAIAFISDKYFMSKYVKPTEIAEALKEMSTAEDVYDLIKVTGKFWGRSYRETVSEVDILDVAKDLLAKGYKSGTPEFKEALEKAAKVKVTIASKPVERTAYLEWQAHGGLVSQDIAEININIRPKELKVLLQDFRKMRRNGMPIEGEFDPSFVDLVNWADLMGVPISSAYAY